VGVLSGSQHSRIVRNRGQYGCLRDSVRLSACADCAGFCADLGPSARALQSFGGRDLCWPSRRRRGLADRVRRILRDRR